MKRIIITFGIIILIARFSEAQPVSNDTVVCIIDTTKSYVSYRKNLFAYRNPEFHWQVSIKGHYYDIDQSADKDFASIGFDANDFENMGNVFEKPYEVRMSKEKIRNRFIVVADEWISQQTSMRVLGNKIGYSPSNKYNFIVFKQDFENAKSDSVTMHRVSIGYYSKVD
jgi:hypothetical protein